MRFWYHSWRDIPFGCFLCNRYSTENRQKDVAFFCRFGKRVARVQKMGKLQDSPMLYCARAFCYNGRARTVVMDINATASRKTPRSMRLASALKDSILRGKWKPGDVLPSIREIAAMAG
ncbi:MAG: GntR family transcriptional regulator, partial [Lentisphaeria bacterium]|nr:GntR family transcriptional regulator [Lentisphaeria bacterium]